jgi:response regulator RpfG family c-di-GMP phosphodiesterase
MSRNPIPELPTRVLIVDDESDLRRMLARFLTQRGYDVSQAASGAEALMAVHAFRPTVMLLDINLPGMSGVEVLPEALELDPDLAIVMLTGASDAATATACLQRGALDFVTKPFDLERVHAVLRQAERRRDTAAQDREISRWLKQEVTRRTQELEDARRRQEELTVAMLEVLVIALEAKSPYFVGRSARVADYAASIATQLGLPDPEVEQVRVAGRLRDLGMIGIREEVLNKQGPLTPEEYAHVQEHVVIGSRILAPLAHLGAVVEIVRSHHERWDGRGYPDRRGGTDIPLAARIIHVAEAYDALTTPRPYQAKLGGDEAVARIRELSGTAFDPRIVDALAAAVGRRQTLEFVLEDTLPADVLERLDATAA